MPDATAQPWKQLGNGMLVRLEPSKANDFAAVAMFLPCPAAVETPAEAGLVSFSHRLLSRGTKRKTSAELAEAIDSLGVTLGCDAADDYSFAHVVTAADLFEESLSLLAEVIREPSFEPEEVEKERQNTLAAIRQSEDDKLGVALRHFLRNLYKGHGYGLPGRGFTESVGEFTREQIVNVHDELLRCGPVRVCITGNFDPGIAVRLLERKFPAISLEQPVKPAVSIAVPQFDTEGRARLTRECEQAYLVMGFPAAAITHPDFPALRVLNAVLGDGMSSRLFLKLRDEQGLAYAIGSSYSALRLAGHMFGYIGTKPESLETAREGMLAQFDRIKHELIPSEELQRTKNYLIGKFLIDHQTNYKRAFYPGHFEMMGLGAHLDDEFPHIIEAVTAEEIREAANRYLNNPAISEVVPNSA
jgi:zinc protease